MSFEDLYWGGGCHCLWTGDFVDHDGVVFSVWADGSLSGSTAWHGTFGCADDPLDHWYGRHADRMDLLDFPIPSFSDGAFHFLSGVVDYYDHFAGDMLRIGTPEGARKYCVNAE